MRTQFRNSGEALRQLAKRFLHCYLFARNLTEAFMGEGASSRRNTLPKRLYSYCLVRGVSTIILMAFIASMDHPSLAAVYECRDAVGKSVLTNRQQGLHSCRLVIKEVPTSAATKMAPEQPSATALPNQASHADEPSTVLPTYKDAPESALPPPSSCRQGVNLLNPLIATPCPHPDPSSQRQPSMDDDAPNVSF
jgi:hypothetical protein